MPEKFTPEEIKGAVEREEWAMELERRRTEDVNKAKRVLQEIEKARDDAFLHVSYQYKYRPQYTDELLSKEDAIEFLKRYSEDPGDLQIFNGFNSIEILSAEEGRKYKEEEKKEESRVEQEIADDEEFENLSRRIIPEAEIVFALHPNLESEDNQGISAAMSFVYTLRYSVERPTEYVGELGTARGMDKITNVGWKEHDDLERAFKKAVKVESRVMRGHTTSDGKHHYNVDVVFIDKDNKERLTVSATFGEDGEQAGGMGMIIP